MFLPILLLSAIPFGYNDFVFVKSNHTEAAIKIINSTENCIAKGYIDENGTFVCTDKIKSKLFGNTSKSTSPAHDPKPLPHFMESKPIEYYLINIPKHPGESVFEFRAGRLIPGHLNEKYCFVPDTDAPVINFSDYHYSTSAPRIYNLPGKFVTYSEYKVLQAQKKP